jgi:CheY-like chemotaxis protein
MKKVLIVDDDIDFTHMLKMTLQLTGRYQIRAVNQSTTALEIAREFQPDLIILDCMMPVLDGGELAARIQADPELRNTPFIFLTATVSANEQAASTCFAGTQTFLAKPFKLGDLVDCIERKTRPGDEAPGLPVKA